MAIHSTVLGRAVGGCRVWPYPGWRDGLEDALRLSAGMTRKYAVAGADLLVSDIDPGKRALAAEVGARWAEPQDAVTADADVLVPAALGGILSREIVPRLRCAAIAGPANNQLAEPAVAGLLHRRRIVWVPDYVAGAGGVIYALAVELDKQTPQAALTRVKAIAGRAGAGLTPRR